MFSSDCLISAFQKSQDSHANMDTADFRKAGKQMVDIIADYVDTIRDRPVLPRVVPGYLKEVVPERAPENGEPWEEVFKDIDRVVMPGMVHWSSPNFHAYFSAGNSFPAICADMLADALGCIGFTWATSPVCTEMEMAMMDWLGKMIGLPEEFLFCSGGKGGGVIQTTASETVLVCLIAARKKIIGAVRSRFPDLDDVALFGRLVAYTSEEANTCVKKAGLMGNVQMRVLPSDDNFSMRGDTLRAAIQEDRAKGNIPFFVVSTLGTTSSCAFDNLTEIGQVCQQEDLWLHIDAAYAGSAFICPEFRPLLNGVEYARSLSINPHKWMLINFDCSTMWVKDRNDLLDALCLNAPYLTHKNEGQVPDFGHWQIPLGRRFRALKMWFVFRMYGVKGLQAHIRKHVKLAHEFEALVKQDPRFEIVVPVKMGLVCFRLKASEDVNKRLLQHIHERQKINLTPTVIHNEYVLRFAVCARDTNSEDILVAWREIIESADDILQAVDGYLTWKSNQDDITAEAVEMRKTEE